MRRLALLLAVVACGGSAPKTADTETFTRSATFLEDDYQPAYAKPDLQQALAAERAAVALAEQRLSEQGGDAEDAAKQDLAVRRRFVASLEACEANGRLCPPRLDEPAWSYDIEKEAEPQLDTVLRFDLTSWQKVAAELHGRACACRTQTCTETLAVAIDRLEQRPMPDVQNDDTALLSIVRARECLDRLRGRKPTPRVFATE